MQPNIFLKPLNVFFLDFWINIKFIRKEQHLFEIFTLTFNVPLLNKKYWSLKKKRKNSYDHKLLKGTVDWLDKHILF